MKRRAILAGVLLTLTATQVLAAPVIDPEKLFDAVKVFTDKVLVLNDFIEFSEFDLSEVKFINDQAPITVLPPVIVQKIQPKKKGAKKAFVQPPPPLPLTGVEAEVRGILSTLPQAFYVGLKRQIYLNKIPVTLYPKETPGFAKPLKLYVKIKKLHIKQPVTQSDGSQVEQVELRIYGQLKDKQADAAILKYYDSENVFFALDRQEASGAFAAAADRLMRDLALYLKLRY